MTLKQIASLGKELARFLKRFAGCCRSRPGFVLLLRWDSLTATTGCRLSPQIATARTLSSERVRSISFTPRCVRTASMSALPSSTRRDRRARSASSYPWL